MKKLFIVLCLWLLISVTAYAKTINIGGSIYVNPNNIESVRVYKVENVADMYMIYVHLNDGRIYKTEPMHRFAVEYEINKLRQVIRK